MNRLHPARCIWHRHNSRPLAIGKVLAGLVLALNSVSSHAQSSTALDAPAVAATSAPALPQTRLFDARDFGALGDGKTDDSAALQKAIDAAAKVQGTVQLAPGTYLCADLKLRPRTGLYSHPNFSYGANGGAILKLNNPKAACLLDLRGAHGATIEGICFDGADRMGENVHGLSADKPDYGSQEDAWRIERCRVSGFSGHGVYLNRIWCFSIRHSMICFNKGNGIWIRGWDGFILDNWLSGNGSAGYGAYEENASITMTGNRIEWNATAGIDIRGGNHYNITGNYLDRSGGPGIKIVGRGQSTSRVISVTGNVIFRSGAPNWGVPQGSDNSQMRFENVEGLTCTGNTANVGRNDGGQGEYSPRFGIVCHKLADSVITANVLFKGALESVLLDEGDHGDNVIIRDNVGRLYVRPTPSPAPQK